MTTPYPYQIEAATQIDAFDGRALLALPMGTGKSLIALYWALMNPHARPIVIVCPATLKWNWEEEAMRHVGMRCIVLEHMKPRKKPVVRRNNILVINYDILSGWLEFLKDIDPKLVILDEVHAIKSLHSKRTKNTRKLCNKVPNIIALSGTPIVSRPSELFPILNILRPDIFPTFFPYGSTYCRLTKTMWGWDYRGARNTKKLNRVLLQTCMLRKTKEELLKDLPPKIRSVVPLPIKNRGEYDKAASEYLDWWESGESKSRAFRKNDQKSKLFDLKKLAAMLKLPSVFEWLDNFLSETNEKIIVFAWHHCVIDALYERYPDSVTITGKTTQVKRKKRFKQFLNDPDTRIMFGNIQAAGVGLSALGVSHTAVVELPWNPGDLAQAEDRVHGVGRGKIGISSNIYYLIARNTVEDSLCRIIQRKQGTLDSVLDGKRTESGIDIYDQLSQTMIRDYGKT